MLKMSKIVTKLKDPESLTNSSSQRLLYIYIYICYVREYNLLAEAVDELPNLTQLFKHCIYNTFTSTLQEVNYFNLIECVDKFAFCYELLIAVVRYICCFSSALEPTPIKKP